jgi:cathepsin E
MLLVSAIAHFVVLAMGVAAGRNGPRNSLISVSITKNITFAGNSSPLLRDQKRWRHLVKGDKQSTSEDSADLPLIDTAVIYSANVGVGVPATYCESCRFPPRILSYTLSLDNLIIDTGSSNTWLGANKPYKRTKASVKTSELMVSIDSNVFQPNYTKRCKSGCNIWFWLFRWLLLFRKNHICSINILFQVLSTWIP